MIEAGNGKLRKLSILTSHQGYTKSGEKIDIEFHLKQESDGTKRMFELSSQIANALDEGKVLIVDELDTHLHPDICAFILYQFHYNNPNNAQILFTSHSISLLNKVNLLRRDQIWFTEKNIDGATEIFSLASLKERDGENYLKRYEEGRYGAKPFIPQLQD